MLAERMYFYGKLKNVFLRTNTLVRDSRGRAVIPSLKKVQETCRGYRLILVLPDGMVPDQVQDVVNHIAYACRCPDVRFDVRDEKVILYFNYRKLPDLVVFNWQDPGSGILPIYIGESWAESVTIDLVRCPHVLIGGETGSGKTKLLQLMVVQLAGKCNLYVADLGRTDLAFTQELGATFIDTREKLLEIVGHLHQKLFSRLAWLKENKFENVDQAGRKHDVLVIDELAVFRPRTGMKRGDKQELMAGFGKLEDLAAVGRKAGINLVLATQHPNRDVIPPLLRENLPCRVCFKTVSIWGSMAVLGNPEAVNLPGVKGRCVIQYQSEQKEMQVAYISRERIWELAHGNN